jgi:hypothetical protein
MALQLQIVTPAGQGYLLGEEVEDLSYSNVRPGGDETCTFTLRRSWLAQNPELRKGSIVRVVDALDVLWQGRLEDDDRGQDGSERVEVTCYGLGARLKDGLFRQIFVDRELGAWEGMSRARKLSLVASSVLSDGQVTQDTTNGIPALIQSFVGAWSAPFTPISESLYDAGADGLVGSVYYDTTASLPGGGAVNLYSATDDAGGGTVNLANTGTGASGYATLSTPARFLLWQLTSIATPGGTEDQTYYNLIRSLAVYGSTGLALRGPDPGGFTADQLIGYIVGLVQGVSARNVQPMPYVWPHFVIDTPTSHQDAIESANEAEGAVWGTWGPDSTLDRSSAGYFDYRQPDVASRGDWIVSRADCEDVELHQALGSMYNKLRINWRDSAGAEHVEIRTAVIPALEDAGMGLAQGPRELELDAGVGSQGSAQRHGDIFFALQGTDPPSVGSVELERRIRHASRGYLPPHYMRADASTLRITDALPYSQSISLQTVDRRTVFPIQRVDVDASGPAPRVAVDLAQSSDRMSALQAREGAAAAYGDAGGFVGGGSGSSGGTPTAAVGKSKGKKKKAHQHRRWRGGGKIRAL